MLTTGYTERVLNEFKKFVVQQSRSRLTKGSSKYGSKNNSKKLYNSIKGEAKVNKNSLSLAFFMEDYGYYQDRGVHGKISSYTELGRYKTLARFGSGKGKKGGLGESILEWVKSKRFQFTDKKKRLLSYKSTAFLISRSIYNKGLKPSLFFTKPFEQGFKKLPDELLEAYGLDVEEFLQFTLNKR